MSKLRVLDLFSGIGGFSLGLERTGGFETVAFCEIEDYPQKVLAKHWPGVPIYDDVREVTAERLIRDGIGVDIITGGFPCQDISAAGNQAGIGEGTRSGLWSECARLLREVQPRYAIFENVTALLSGDNGGWFQQVLWDISQVGYDAEWHCIPASELGAHHHRDRVWIVAYPGGGRGEKRHPEHTKQDIKREADYAMPCSEDGANTHGNNVQGKQPSRANQEERQEQKERPLRPLLTSIAGKWEPEPSVGRVANGIPKRSHRLKALGNAVVPQIPEIIGRAILKGAL